MECRGDARVTSENTLLCSGCNCLGCTSNLILFPLAPSMDFCSV